MFPIDKKISFYLRNYPRYLRVQVSHINPKDSKKINTQSLQNNKCYNSNNLKNPIQGLSNKRILTNNKS